LFSVLDFYQEAVKRHEGGLERKKSKKTSDRELGKDVDDG